MIQIDTRKVEIAVSKFIKLAKGRTAAFSAIFIQDLTYNVVISTPVKTGFLRASWYASVDSPPSLQSNQGVDPSGSTTIARCNIVAATMKLGQIYYLVNGASYAVHVEFGTKHMRGRRMVGSTLDKANKIAKEAALKAARLG